MRAKYCFTLLLLISIFTYPCTTAIISAKASADGRPMLLKNRDSDYLQNKVVSFTTGPIHFIGVVNTADLKNEEIWIGFNAEGFGIMNSASYNLKGNDTTKLTDQEGRVMKAALASCRTLADFENFLRQAAKPLGVEANFGVIDAEGGAAYYEVNNYTFTKYDVNDPQVAPDGYLIRTNYSCSGADNKGFGYIRYGTASELFGEQYSHSKFTDEFLIRIVPRCLIQKATGSNLEQALPENESDTTYVPFRDYIPRYSSASATVIKGVAAGEQKSGMMMWTILGFPLTSVAVPVWLLPDGAIPALLQSNNGKDARMNAIAMTLKKRVFPALNDAKENYIILGKLLNKSGTGIRQELNEVEAEVVRKGKILYGQICAAKAGEAEVRAFYLWLDDYIPDAIGNRLRNKSAH
ncbi:MAG: hypothetical protein LWX56_10955 [Ignavibacteria bacterium]|nr:hypothetical protein [Ignavibacteria bacterium]